VVVILLALFTLLALPILGQGLGAELLPAVSITVPGDNPCLSSLRCILSIYRAVEEELYRRYPECAAGWGTQRLLREGRRVSVVVTVRCIQLHKTEL
jgi:hypothetical protein